MTKRVLSGAVAVWAFAVPASAALVPIVNPGFEDLTGSDPAHFLAGKLIDGHFATNSPGHGPNAFLTADPAPGWDVSNDLADGGTYNPTVADYPGGIPGGEQVAYSNGPLILQHTPIVVENNKYYTVSVYVGRRASNLLYDGYELFLRANGLSLQTSVELKHANPALGEWDQAVLYGFSGNQFLPPGTTLDIWLGTRNGPVDWDNVSVDVSDTAPAPIVPEPALTGMALPLVALMTRRRKR